MIHIHTAPMQPATRFVIHVRENGRRIWCRCSPRSLHRCSRCGRRRWAKNLLVQVFYDGIYHYCRNRDGCENRLQREDW